ncbi:alpha/beta hydrolase [Desulfonema ishimotonii]|uniref:Alpha/beta hydrolase n=1 Tax=Desulfonema ishimotonii TaxID=45657 RepID=A0A401G2V1_9BACT|nr:alpha/beta hydrolase [Desulfonema ishimotonii]GBC63560.1 alpha/beta hydrolase [Desulfonema ishimotonii]
MGTFIVFPILYLFASVFFTYMVHRQPRRPVRESPDWGTVTDTRIPAADGGFLEVWRIEPDGPSRGIVVLAHGWGRNRDRMVSRARMFGKWGYTTVIHSARDHGGSSPCRMMNGIRFGEDIGSVLGWVGEPVILYGHSAGSAGAAIAAHRHPELVSLLFLEGSYADVKPALFSLYKSFNRYFGLIFGPAIIFWMDKVLYRERLEALSPVALAPEINVPVLLIHGQSDATFPVAFAKKLARSFPGNGATLWIARGAGHSDSSLQPGYREAVGRFLEAHWFPADAAVNG